MVKWSYPGRSCLDDRALSREEAIALQKQRMGDHDLMEAVSDSDWAGHYDRISSSCGRIFLNGNMVHGFARKQGAVSLSSCEAELISCVSTSAEAIYLRHITRTLSSAPCDILCRLDSSSARSLLQKRGVSKIRHLDCKLLWLQRAAQERQLSFGAISTYLNTSDIGTKALTAERYGFLMVRLGFKGFATSSTDKIKLDKLQGRILRLMVLMDALKCADASEPNAMFNFEGVYVNFESVLSLHLFLPAWSLVLLAVVCGCVVGWMIWKYWCAEKGLVFEQHAEQGQNQDEQQHEGEVQHDQQHEGEVQHDQQHEGEVQHEQQHEGEVQHEQQHEGEVQHDQQHEGGVQHEQQHEGEVQHQPQHEDNPEHQPIGEGHQVHGEIRTAWNGRPNPPNWPQLVFCPRSGSSYHVRGCGNLKASNLVAVYTYDRHVRAPLAPCQVCNPAVLPGSASVRVRRRHR